MYSDYFSKPFAAKVAKCDLVLANKILAEVASRASVNTLQKGQMCLACTLSFSLPLSGAWTRYLDVQQPSDHEN